MKKEEQEIFNLIRDKLILKFEKRMKEKYMSLEEKFTLTDNVEFHMSSWNKQTGEFNISIKDEIPPERITMTVIPTYEEE